MTHTRPCQICKCDRLTEISEFGDLVVKPVFPVNSIDSVSTRGVQLLFCQECGFVQLGYTFSPQEMYEYDYCYGGRLNDLMGSHFGRIFYHLEVRANLHFISKMHTVSEEGVLVKNPDYLLLLPLPDREAVSN